MTTTAADDHDIVSIEFKPLRPRTWRMHYSEAALRCSCGWLGRARFTSEHYTAETVTATLLARHRKHLDTMLTDWLRQCLENAGESDGQIT